MIAIIIFTRRLNNRWLRGLLLGLGVVLALVTAANFPSLFGTRGVSSAGRAGEYFFYLGVLALIIKFVFFKTKAEPKQAT